MEVLNKNVLCCLFVCSSFVVVAGHYKVYNLCCEKEYDEGSFELCARYGHHDHNPPPFQVHRRSFAPKFFLLCCSFPLANSTLLRTQMMVEFCKDAVEYIGKDPKNVAVVRPLCCALRVFPVSLTEKTLLVWCQIHCKAGKGRTGTVIAALLQHQDDNDHIQALNVFGKARTKVPFLPIPEESVLSALESVSHTYVFCFMFLEQQGCHDSVTAALRCVLRYYSLPSQRVLSLLVK